MHRTKYGILLQDITDLQLTILLDTGSTAAKQVIQKRYFGKPAKRLKLNKRIEELYRIGITFNSMYDELPYPSIVSILTVPKKRIERLPLRALINPTNNPTLNNKLSQVYWDETLEQNEKNIRFSNLIFDDQDLIFTASDIKKIRFSIIWLNHIMSMKLKTKLYQKCLSNDAFKIFISEGFRGLYRISKKNKRKLNRFFKAADEVENMDFLRLSSIGLNNLWNY